MSIYKLNFEIKFKNNYNKIKFKEIKHFSFNFSFIIDYT